VTSNEFAHVTPRDFQNGAVRDEIAATLRGHERTAEALRLHLADLRRFAIMLILTRGQHAQPASGLASVLPASSLPGVVISNAFLREFTDHYTLHRQDLLDQDAVHYWVTREDEGQP